MLDILDILLRGNEVQVSTSEGGRMGILIHYLCGWGFIRASLVAQVVKNPPAMRETWVRSLGWEDLLEKGIATHSSTLAWRTPLLQAPLDNFFFLKFMPYNLITTLWASQVAPVVKNPPAIAVEARGEDLIAGSGRSPRVGNGYPFQYSCLENSMDRWARQDTVHGVAKSWT